MRGRLLPGCSCLVLGIGCAIKNNHTCVVLHGQWITVENKCERKLMSGHHTIRPPLPVLPIHNQWPTCQQSIQGEMTGRDRCPNAWQLKLRFINDHWPTSETTDDAQILLTILIYCLYIILQPQSHTKPGIIIHCF